MNACVPSCVRLFETPWTIAHQTPLTMEFSQQEYWSGLPFPPLGDLSDPGIKLMSPIYPALQVDSLPLSYWGNPFSYACIFIIFKSHPMLHILVVNCSYHLAIFCGYVSITICKNLHPMFYLFLEEFNLYIYFYFWLCWAFIAMCGLFSSCIKGKPLHYGAWASCGGFSCCKLRLQGLGASVVVALEL